MAVNSWGSRITFADAMKTVMNGQYMGFVNTLVESNPIMQDIPVMPGNGILSHEGARLDALPTPEILDIAEGWSSQSVTFDKYKAVISLFKMRLDIPEDILKLQPNRARFRADLEDACGEGFGQGVVNHVIYGTSVGAGNSKKFDGLGTYRVTPDATDPISVTNGDYATFDAGGGTGSDTTSIWLIQPGYRKVFFVTPANDSRNGMDRQDIGRVEAWTNQVAVIADSSVTRKTRYDIRTEFEQKLGLVIADERALARIRNVPTTRASFTSDLIFELIMQAREEVFKGPEPVFAYMNGRLRWILKTLNVNKQNVILDKNNPYDILMNRIGDVYIRPCDALLKTETGVAAA
jgi:hypothetical protein